MRAAWTSVAVLALALALALASARDARAQEAPRDDAQALFEAARALMVEGRFVEACPKLERSEALDPGIGTEFNLARCYDLANRPAAALAMYARAIAAMRVAGQTDREAIARGLAAAVEARVAHVKLSVRAEDTAPGFELALDGTRVEREAWGTSIPVDPGTHVVAASAPAFFPWKGELTIDRAGQSITILVPRLVAVLAPLPPAVAPPPSGRGRVQRALGLVVAGLGVGGVGVGSYFGIRAMSLRSQCAGVCDAKGSLWHDALSAGDASTISFVIGGVLLATGAALWLTAPSEPSRP